MNQINELHIKAMQFAELAEVAQLEGDFEKANRLFLQAYENEVKAAEVTPHEPSAEPTRSILYRSAASLALDCGKNREAERLVAIGLSGDPPYEIAEELRDLFEKVNFRRHLELRGVTLEPDEVQMSIAGNIVSPGSAPSNQLVTRIEFVRKLIYRTVERITGKAYREGGLVSRAFRDYDLFVSVPRASSFAISLKVSRPTQPPLPVFGEQIDYVEPGRIIDEILDCLEIFDKSEENALQNKIPDKAYYRNFVGIAKNIAPDGKDISLVGFTTIRQGKKKIVDLRKPRRLIKAVHEMPERTGEERKIQTVVGTLKFADEVYKEKSKIKLVDKNGVPHRVIIPEGMMSDIVRPLWGELVAVTGYYTEKGFNLQDINRATIE